MSTLNQIAVLTPEQIADIVQEAYSRGAKDTMALFQQKDKIDWASVPNYLTATEAARLVNKHPSTIVRKCNADLIKFSLVRTAKGYKISIAKDDFRKFIDNKK